MKISKHEIILTVLTFLFIVFVTVFSLVPQTEDLNIVTGSDESATAYLIDINTADAEELVTLDGIGEKTADKIIEYRNENGNFKTADELCEVPGIGPSTLDKIKDYIKV